MDACAWRQGGMWRAAEIGCCSESPVGIVLYICTTESRPASKREVPATLSQRVEDERGWLYGYT